MAELQDLSDAQLVGVYRKLRELKETAKDEAAQAIAPVLEQMKSIEALCNGRLLERGCNSFSTDEGTCYTSTINTFSTKDRTAFLDWVIATDNWDMVDVRPAKKEVEAYLDEHKSLPVGLGASTKVNTNFKAPRKAA